MLWENRVKSGGGKGNIEKSGKIVKLLMEWCKGATGSLLGGELKKYPSQRSWIKQKMHLTKYQVLTNPKTLRTVQQPPSICFQSHNWGTA